MDDDYRLTESCESFGNISEKKQVLMNEIKSSHPRAKDIHKIVSENTSEYKSKFLEVYCYRCAYCGTSLRINTKSQFEFDHFIPKTSNRFKSESDAGFIENLVLACHTCNHNKSNFELSENSQEILNPDFEKIKKIYYRDNMFYIRVSQDASHEAMEFYKKLELGRETCRIDYLLLSMMELRDKIVNDDSFCCRLNELIDLLLCKRNSMI